MILSFGLVSVALVVLLLLLYLEGGHQASVPGLEHLAARTRRVDLDAFKNLTDPEEDDFLRANLHPRDFRAIQRQRTRSAMEYILNTVHNAAVLLRLGEAASRSTDPSIAVAGRQLVESALHLRWYGLLSLAKLGLRMLLPGARLSYGHLGDRYQALTDLARQLALKQYSAQATGLSNLL